MEPARPHHAAFVFEALQDPGIYTWISATPPPSLAALQKRWQPSPNQEICGASLLNLEWVIRRVSDGHYIGTIDAEIRDDRVATNIGYIIFRPFWAAGYATEAVRSLVEYLTALDSPEQWAFVTKGNLASARVLERAGFVYEALLPANDTIRGVIVDDWKYVRRGGAPAGLVR